MILLQRGNLRSKDALIRDSAPSLPVRPPSLRARVYRDDDSADLGGLKFEIENVGGRPTSLNPAITVSYWLLKDGALKPGTATYAVREVDRELPPFNARTFTASKVDTPRNYGFSWFRTYTFTSSTGHVARFMRDISFSIGSHHWSITGSSSAFEHWADFGATCLNP